MNIPKFIKRIGIAITKTQISHQSYIRYTHKTKTSSPIPYEIYTAIAVYSLNLPTKFNKLINQSIIIILFYENVHSKRSIK